MAAACAPDRGMSGLAARFFTDAVAASEHLVHPRAWAFALIGIHAYLRQFGGDAQARRVRKVLAEKLFALFQERAKPDWPWCDDRVTYANAKLPHALILSGQWLPRNRILSHDIITSIT